MFSAAMVQPKIDQRWAFLAPKASPALVLSTHTTTTLTQGANPKLEGRRQQRVIADKRFKANCKVQNTRLAKINRYVEPHNGQKPQNYS